MLIDTPYHTYALLNNRATWIGSDRFHASCVSTKKACTSQSEGQAFRAIDGKPERLAANGRLP